MSTNVFFALPETRHRLHQGPLGAHIDAFAARLQEQGFSPERARDKIRVIADFSGWLHRHGLGADDIDTRRLNRYLKDRGRDLHAGRGAASTLHTLVCVLCERGIVGQARPPEPADPRTRVERDFERYLSQERGLSPATLTNYVPFVHQLLLERFRNGPIQLAKLSATDITGFVRRHARDHSPGRRGPMVAALRAFLRHLRHRGEITTDLAGCVPAVANWSHAALPQFLQPGQVAPVLKHCHRGCPPGRRDYAILLLLARLGLRAGEVVALTLDDIDWTAGHLTVRGKGGRWAQLPLPAAVGEAIAAYLQHGRPPCASRRLFIRHRAPRVGFANAAGISTLVKRALARAGVDSPRTGAHLFRHTLATEMLRRGASLTEIGTLLRHQHPGTTTIYAKVDLPALRRLAPAWPGGGR